MVRADLHNALALDREIYDASQVDPSVLDPIVRVEGALPGTARPVTVLRDYQGPQGVYTEYFVLSDHAGEERFRSRVQRVELRGEMFEDRLTDQVTGLRLADAEEHLLTFYVNDDEVGAIPVFVEAGLGGDPYAALEQAVAKALQKGTILWLSVPQPDGRRGRAQPPREQAVWFVLEDGKVYVLTGPSEQQVPGLASARTVDLLVRSKEVRSRIARVPADVRVVATDDPLFETVGSAGMSKRLNLPDGDRAIDRWRAQCTLVELTPRFRPSSATAEGAGGEPSVDQAAGRGLGAAAAAAPSAPSSPTEAETEAPAPAAAKTEDVHVEAEIDQEVFDALITEGKSERVARAKAKAAFVRREKARLRAEQESPPPDGSG